MCVCVCVCVCDVRSKSFFDEMLLSLALAALCTNKIVICFAQLLLALKVSLLYYISEHICMKTIQS